MKLAKEPEPHFNITRRTLLAGAAIGVTQMAAPFVVTARAAESIKIGLLLPKSGPYAVQGETGKNGAQIAVDDFGGSRSSGSTNPVRNRPSKTCES
jgi:branched-chain amino acid transport system substrate-binding protein